MNSTILEYIHLEDGQWLRECSTLLRSWLVQIIPPVGPFLIIRKLRHLKKTVYGLIEDVSGHEKTEVINGVENTLPLSLQCFAQVNESHDSFGDSTLPSVIMTTEPIKNAYLELLKRGIRTRFITEISEKNIEYCKELKKIVYELRHLEGVKGNFGVSESDYIATAMQQEEHLIPQLIHSNAKAVIEQQQYIFQTLWEKAIPAQIRIRELEEGISPEKN